MIELYACKMRRLNQLNSTRYHLNATSRIFDWASRIFDWKLYFDPNVAFYMCRIKCIMLNILSSILLVTLFIDLRAIWRTFDIIKFDI